MKRILVFLFAILSTSGFSQQLTKAKIDSTIRAQLAVPVKPSGMLNASLVLSRYARQADSTANTKETFLVPGSSSAYLNGLKQWITFPSIPNDALLMHLAGTETVTGLKNYTTAPTIGGVAIATASNTLTMSGKTLTTPNIAGGNISANMTVGAFNIYPTTTNTGNIGQAANYFSGIYSTRNYFNSTAYIDGATAGRLTVTGDLYGSGAGLTGIPFTSGISAKPTTLSGYGITDALSGAVLDTANIGFINRPRVVSALWNFTTNPTFNGAALVNVSGTQTLTAKTLTAPTISGANITGSVTMGAINLYPTTNGTGNIGQAANYFNGVYSSRHYANSASYIDGTTAGSMGLFSGSSETMRLFSSGNVGIGTAVDNGYKVDVAGQLRVQSGLYTSNNIIPTDNNIQTVGGISNFFANSYLNRVNVSTTAAIDGATSGVVNITGILKGNGSQLTNIPSTAIGTNTNFVDLTTAQTKTGALTLSSTAILSAGALPLSDLGSNLGSSALRFNAVYSGTTYANTLRANNSTGVAFANQSGVIMGQIYNTTGNWGLQNGGTFTDNLAGLQLNHSITASAGNAFGLTSNQTLTATANNDNLTSVSIVPNYVNGAFTGVTNNAIRHWGNIIPTSSNAWNLGSLSNVYNNVYTSYINSASGDLNIRTNGSNAILVKAASQNILMGGGTVDNGSKVQITGDESISGNLNISGQVNSVQSATSAIANFTTGTLKTTPVAGDFEATGDKLYYTIQTGAARKEVALVDGLLTLGRFALGGSNGRLTENSTAIWTNTGGFRASFGTTANTANLNIGSNVLTSGTNPLMVLTGAAHTGVTLGTESPDIDINLARTVTWNAANGVATQRAVRISAPTYASNTAGFSMATAATVSISGAPIPGLNTTITNPYAFNVETGNVRLGGGLSVVNSITAAGNINASANLGSATLQVTSNATVGGTLGVTGNTTLTTLTSTGNATFTGAAHIIGAGANSGELMQVNGTAKITGNLTVKGMNVEDRFAYDYAGTADLNAADKGGVYSTGSTTINSPEAYTTAMVFVGATPSGDAQTTSGSWTNQILAGTSGNLYFRQRIYTYGSWTPSYKIITSKDLDLVNIVYRTGVQNIDDKKTFTVTPRMSNMPVYANDAAAAAGGLVSGDMYKTSAGVLMIR